MEKKRPTFHKHQKCNCRKKAIKHEFYRECTSCKHRWFSNLTNIELLQKEIKELKEDVEDAWSRVSS